MMTPASSIRVFAGLDGGATKTRVRIVDIDGGFVGEGSAGPGSLTLSPEIAADHCRQALLQALAGSGIGFDQCQLVSGVAGHRQSGRRDVYETCLRDVGTLEVLSDGYIALLGAHGGAAGAIVIAGTGSVALSLDGHGRASQIGGYGPVVGDEGGGNWLGREAVRAALKAMDDVACEGGSMSCLAASLIDHIGGDHEAMLDWISAADSTRFASLVPMLLRHADAGDPLACRLLEAAADEASRLIRLASRRGRLAVSLVGGLAEVLRPRLPAGTRASLKPPEGDPMDGALLRARGLAGPEVYDGD